MGSGCGDPIVEFHPSSSGQLPVPVALNAGSPTLFPHTIHHNVPNVNNFLVFFPLFSQIWLPVAARAAQGPPDASPVPHCPKSAGESDFSFVSANRSVPTRADRFYSCGISGWGSQAATIFWEGGKRCRSVSGRLIPQGCHSRHNSRSAPRITLQQSEHILRPMRRLLRQRAFPGYCRFRRSWCTRWLLSRPDPARPQARREHSRPYPR